MPWWQDAVFYQVYVRSFADSDGDGVGDLEGIRSRLGYLELLGVDALWLTPFYRSPMADHGYDVADPRDVDPLFGDLAAFDRLVADAHGHGIRVTVDLVPNHTSDQHPWFQAALRGGPERARYHFRPGRGPGGEQPPNNWTSVFGGPAWTRTPDGSWYLHLFAPEQPDLNWDDADVRADLVRTLRFWLDRGVDGFRIDVAHGMAKAPGLPDLDPAVVPVLTGAHAHPAADPRFDNDEVHDVHRMIRQVVDRHPGAVTIGEIWVETDERFARYVRPDELHLGFNFALATTAFDADSVRRAVERSVAAVGAGTPTWTLSNHDVERHVTRYGGGEVGLRRARAMALVELALPGVAFLYNGEELGLPNADLPEWALQDPIFERTGGAERGRDGCRVPLPWEGPPPTYGFSPGDKSWLPMPPEWAAHTVESQLEDPGSMLSLYRHAIELRKTSEAFAGTELEWYGAPPGCFAFRRKGGGLICALNTSDAPVPLPPGTTLLASGPLDGEELPPETAAWLV
ncbi:alpha-amylase [Actinokineospora bangkokensis]|uniref:Alpha-amylase n=1 Tax=Actinokineospora bangkokensis TaxID=1193682 RepID=A0A1Q9LC56_9PSEU|nr:alpha-amylase [Actinokineospora bangkokensis]